MIWNYFAHCREALKAKQKDLKSQGKGNKPNRADPLTDRDVETLFQCGQLAMDSPQAMINTLWLINTVVFGLRGGNEHRDICAGVMFPLNVPRTGAAT